MAATKRMQFGQDRPFRNYNKFIVKRWKRFRKIAKRGGAFKNRLAARKRKLKINRQSWNVIWWHRLNSFVWVENSNFSSWQMFRFVDRWKK